MIYFVISACSFAVGVLVGAVQYRSHLIDSVEVSEEVLKKAKLHKWYVAFRKLDGQG